jgi:hypothetical protein
VPQAEPQLLEYIHISQRDECKILLAAIRREAERAAFEKADVREDKAYLEGMKTGWNCAINGARFDPHGFDKPPGEIVFDDTKFKQLQEARRRELRALAQPAQTVSGEARQLCKGCIARIGTADHVAGCPNAGKPYIVTYASGPGDDASAQPEKGERPQLSAEQVELCLQNQEAYDINDELDSRKLAALLNALLTGEAEKVPPSMCVSGFGSIPDELKPPAAPPVPQVEPDVERLISDLTIAVGCVILWCNREISDQDRDGYLSTAKEKIQSIKRALAQPAQTVSGDAKETNDARS